MKRIALVALVATFVLAICCGCSSKTPVKDDGPLSGYSKTEQTVIKDISKASNGSLSQEEAAAVFNSLKSMGLTDLKKIKTFTTEKQDKRATLFYATITGEASKSDSGDYIGKNSSLSHNVYFAVIDKQVAQAYMDGLASIDMEYWAEIMSRTGKTAAAEYYLWDTTGTFSDRGLLAVYYQKGNTVKPAEGVEYYYFQNRGTC